MNQQPKGELMKILATLLMLSLAACSGKKSGTVSTSEGVQPPVTCQGEGCPPVVKPKLD